MTSSCVLIVTKKVHGSWSFMNDREPCFCIRYHWFYFFKCSISLYIIGALYYSIRGQIRQHGEPVSPDHGKSLCACYVPSATPSRSDAVQLGPLRCGSCCRPSGKFFIFFSFWSKMNARVRERSDVHHAFKMTTFFTVYWASSTQLWKGGVIYPILEIRAPNVINVL